MLNAQGKELVEKYHGLMCELIEKKGLNFDEVYGEAAQKLCEIALRYDPTIHEERTYFRQQINYHLSAISKRADEGRMFVAFTEETLKNAVNEYFVDDVVKRVSVETLLSCLTQEEAEFVKDAAYIRNILEVANLYGMDKDTASRKFNRLLRILRYEYEKGYNKRKWLAEQREGKSFVEVWGHEGF